MKQILILLVASLMIGCSSDNDAEIDTKHEFCVYNDDIETGISNLVVICSDEFTNKQISEFVIKDLKYNSKSSMLQTKGSSISINYDYIVDGVTKQGSRKGIKFLFNGTKTISTSGLSDYLGYNNSSGGGSGSGGSGQTSYTCGAPLKSGKGYCKRKVVGGGRCWQHK